MAIVLAATGDKTEMFFDYTPAEGALLVKLLGIPYGAIYGGVSVLFKNFKFFCINGNLNKWQIFNTRFHENSNRFLRVKPKELICK